MNKVSLALKVKVLIRSRFFLFVFLSLVGCGSSVAEESKTPQVASPVPSAVVSTSTSFATILTTSETDNPIFPTPTLPDVETIKPVPTTSQTLEPTLGTKEPDGTLFLVSFAGDLLRVSIETDEIEPVLSKEEGWLLSQFAVSPDTQRIAYWIAMEEKSELWISELKNWSPEIVLTVSNLEYNAANLWWINNNYLLLEVGNYNHPVYLPTHAYIIDMSEKKIAIEDESLALGCLLARSPRTNMLATWCPAKTNWTNPESYYSTLPSYYAVIEEDNSFWITTGTPEEPIAEILTPQNNWIWSPDRSLVAFPIYESDLQRDVFYFVTKDATVLNPLKDPTTGNLYFNDWLPWSPNNQYLAYKGECSVAECYHVVDRESGQVVWTSERISEAHHARSLLWSYDGQYIVLLADEGSFIVKVSTWSLTKQLELPPGRILVWAP